MQLRQTSPGRPEYSVVHYQYYLEERVEYVGVAGASEDEGGEGGEAAVEDGAAHRDQSVMGPL